jgi:hypothetical protein
MTKMIHAHNRKRGDFELQNITNLMPTNDSFSTAKELVLAKVDKRIKDLEELKKSRGGSGSSSGGKMSSLRYCVMKSHHQFT